MSKRKYGRLVNIIAISLSVGIFIGYVGNNEDVLGLLDDYFKPQVTREVNPVLIGRAAKLLRVLLLHQDAGRL
jgi:hypothetical protein